MIAENFSIKKFGVLSKIKEVTFIVLILWTTTYIYYLQFKDEYISYINEMGLELDERDWDRWDERYNLGHAEFGSLPV